MAPTKKANGESQESQEHKTGLASPTKRSSTAETLYTTRSKDHHLEEAVTGAVPDEDKEEIGQDVDPWLHHPKNPRNWSPRKKWTAMVVVSLYTFAAPLGSSMMAPGLPSIAIHFRESNETIIALTLSIYLLAFAIGPLIVSPISEVWGRSWILHFCAAFFSVFNVACALAPSISTLIIFRFLAGLGGSAPLGVGAGSISDVFAEKDRAAAMALFSLGPLLGPVIGPVAGGFIAQSIGYKWVFWILAILGGVSTVIGVLTLRETYAPIIQRNLEKKRCAENNIPFKDVDRPRFQEILKNDLSRPFMLLTTSFICFILSLYQAITYGYLYLMFTTFPQLYSQTYGWKQGVSGLAYLGIGLGNLVAIGTGTKILDKIYNRLTERNGGVSKPEYRLPLMNVGSILIPVGLLWYGWSADQKAHWIVPILGTFVFGMGMMYTFFPITIYLVDTFKYAASATAAAAFLRSLFGFAFPLFADRMFVAMGVGPGYSMLAGVAILVGIPFPIWIFFKGEEIRARSNQNR